MIQFLINLFKQNKSTVTEVQHQPKYEVLEKYQSNDWEKSMINYSVIIQLNEDCDLKIVAKELQEKMGYHPFGYDFFDLIAESDEHKVKLTWKSWNYCD